VEASFAEVSIREIREMRGKNSFPGPFPANPTPPKPLLLLGLCDLLFNSFDGGLAAPKKSKKSSCQV
jgi:hypothetical protein